MFDRYKPYRTAPHIRDQKKERGERVAKMKGQANSMTAGEWSHRLGVSEKMVKVYARELGEKVKPDPDAPPSRPGQKVIDYDAIDREAAELNRRMMQLWRS
jgi:hypothetical protein